LASLHVRDLGPACGVRSKRLKLMARRRCPAAKSCTNGQSARGKLLLDPRLTDVRAAVRRFSCSVVRRRVVVAPASPAKAPSDAADAHNAIALFSTGSHLTSLRRTRWLWCVDLPPPVVPQGEATHDCGRDRPVSRRLVVPPSDCRETNLHVTCFLVVRG